MGGLGSTRWGWHARRRMIGEGTLELTVAHVRQLAALGDGVAEITWGGVVLDGLLPRMDAVPAPFGGLRYWLWCPMCGKRRRALYTMAPRGELVPKSRWACRWRCRPCSRLAYPSQRLAPLDLLQRHRMRIAARIAGQPLEWGDMPSRPKGRHASRYERELDRLYAIDQALDALFITGATRLLKRYHR